MPIPRAAVNVIVPFPPGGVADASARPVAAGLEKLLKQPFVVTNKPGAGGAVGMAQVAGAKPDGYTLLLALSSISIIPEADTLFDRPPAYRMDQLVPIALLSSDPTVLVVPADSPWKTVKDFVEDAKKRPGEIAFSSSGIYGTLHMAMEMFAHAADIKLRHVPFNGAGPALTELLGGHVQALASGPLVVLPHIKAGKLRVLAGWGDKRVEALPDVPTFKELGYKDVEFYIWAGLFAPAGTPEPIIKTLRESVAQGGQGGRVQDRHDQPADARRLQGRAGVQGVLGRRRQAPGRGRQARRQGRGEEIGAVIRALARNLSCLDRYASARAAS